MQQDTIDQENMKQVILDFPKQFRIGLEAAKNTKLAINFKLQNIIISGMGGSALPGDIFKIINNELLLTNLPILINRNYGLPSEAQKNSVVICISYSGNTEETISSFKEARERGASVLTIASGGKLIDLSKKYHIPFAKVPSGIQPRCALGYQFSALIKILSNLKIIKNLDENLLDLERSLRPSNLEKEGKKLAHQLKGKIPLIYSSEHYQYLARIWKIKFNENSKVPAFFNFFPELNHNEMTGIGECKLKSLRKELKIIILKDKKEPSKILKRMKTLTEIFQEKEVESIFVEIKGKNIFEKVFKSILVADWASYWFAIFQGIDPSPVKLVEEFKKRMA
ncbi:MAG TPA: bifunctional phosphoglucose/phosphomannose isomerase [Candidatus Pacearchaeota archaeon]|nr:bifunctional phosphoglucose/phosphomannose isomerase [Candidatus Pacearchaeota archaeon]HOK94384.1 bifunctional phosphoglucose/phosphomannose isomerase [Candidatus Pacearchaeota archaeon]HPO75314.1 bifunctional phosphoglucose/phosphomannose isomerase [Candidatus Pacearchaeota archaeon]